MALLEEAEDFIATVSRSTLKTVSGESHGNDLVRDVRQVQVVAFSLESSLFATDQRL